MNKKGALEISFSWMFAIIVGIFILFLAIFAVTKILKTEETISDTKISKEIEAILSPLETGFESMVSTSFTLPTESRIYNGCSDEEPFGKQIISLSQKSFNKWSDGGLESSFENKYIFSSFPIEGKKFYVFSKPIEMPFKVADLTYIISSEINYCFKGVDEYGEIKDELEQVAADNLYTILEDCPENSMNVCFGNNDDCDISVDMSNGKTEKEGDILFFHRNDALMYASIFSSSEVYDCQLTRIAFRIKSLAQLYLGKASFISKHGCYSNVGLESLASISSGVDSSSFGYIVSLSEDSKLKNDRSGCKLW